MGVIKSGVVRAVFQSDLLVISSDLITRVSLHELANVHRANNAALTALVAPRYSLPTADGRRKRNKKGTYLVVFYLLLFTI